MTITTGLDYKIQVMESIRGKCERGEIIDKDIILGMIDCANLSKVQLETVREYAYE